MDATEFDEEALFSAIARSGVRALLIGRRALVALGIPVLTADYDLWIHIDDVAALNSAVEPLDLYPTRSPEEARRFGRYVLEGDERVDVLIDGRYPPRTASRCASTTRGPVGRRSCTRRAYPSWCPASTT